MRHRVIEATCQQDFATLFQPHDCEVSLRQARPRDERVTKRSTQRLLGAYYTRTTATDAITDWAIRGDRDKLLEPSFGGGEFLRSIEKVAQARALDALEHYGCELMADEYESAIGNGLIDPSRAYLTDFLQLPPFPVDAVIGNPPYVRLRHLPPPQMQAAMRVHRDVLGEMADPSGSIWMSFLLHATRFIRNGGRLSFVLPYEFTHVRYARPLWRFLGNSFRNLRLVRVHERLFPGLLQEVVVLYADGFGEACDAVEFVAIDRAKDFADTTKTTPVEVPIKGIVEGKKVFVEALLPHSIRGRVSAVLAEKTQPIGKFAKFNIGYVAGSKDFFHPSREVVRGYGIPGRHLLPAITSSRDLSTLGLKTSSIDAPSRLFFPPERGDRLARGSADYILRGKKDGVHKRYKCRVRKPWYKVPGVKTPDLLLSVFSERPVLAINDAQFVASNSLLCGFLHKTTPRQFVSAWYTSLTLLQCELEVHALGGGVFVLVPGEVGRFRLPAATPSQAMLRQVDRRLGCGDAEGAYRAGDEYVLNRQLKLSPSLIDDVHAASELLRFWRTSSRAKKAEEFNGST